VQEKKLVRNTKIIYALLVASVFLLALAPAALTSNASTGSKVIEVKGIWIVNALNSTVLYQKNEVQYGAGWGVGPMTGGIHGAHSQGEFLTKFNLDTGVITFTGQIHCVCTIAGRTGNLWIAFIHGKDVNAYVANGKTTAEFQIVGAGQGLAGVTGYGPMKTTTSSNLMNYTMWITLP
jgi:hypothetical protein